MATWADIQKRIFATESGGDYNALYGYQNRPGGLFDEVRITDMTVDDALDFTNPKGRYGAFVSTQTPDNRIATPIGAYQVVGTTLRDAKRGLGLKGDELMTPELQDRIGKWIYETQGAGAWEGLKGKGAMEPTGILGAMAGQQEEDTPFYKTDRFGNVMDSLIVGLNSMRLNPDENIAKMAQGRMARRQQKAQTNRTLEWMRANGYGQYADMVESGQIPAKTMMSTLLAKQLEGPAKPVEVGGKLVNPTTGAVVYDPMAGREGQLTKDQMSSLNSLRDDLRTELSQFELVKSGYNNIMTFYNDPSGTSDYALAVAFAKILDPGSVAREGEVAAVRNAGAKIPAFGQAMKNVIDGKGSFTPEVREQIATLSMKLYQERAQDAQSKIVKRRRNRAQVRPSNGPAVWGGIPEPKPIVPSKLPAKAERAGMTQEDWDALSMQSKAAFLE